MSYGEQIKKYIDEFYTNPDKVGLKLVRLPITKTVSAMMGSDVLTVGTPEVIDAYASSYFPNKWFISEEGEVEKGDLFIQVKYSQTLNKNDIIGYGLLLSGRSTTFTASKLIDSTATFIADNIEAGQIVMNTATNKSATVTTVDSETQLTLSADIFRPGQEYEIKRSYRVKHIYTININNIVCGMQGNLFLVK